MSEIGDRVELRVWLEQRGVDWTLAPTQLDPPASDLAASGGFCSPVPEYVVAEPWTFPLLAEPDVPAPAAET